MKRANISVITRTKDRPILLRRAIESVLSQKYEDWLMVIINDGGVQNDVEQLASEYKERFNGRLHIIHNRHSLGMEAASNIGLQNSDSEYVVIHDDDDSWHPDFLDAAIKYMQEKSITPIAGVVTHSQRVIERIDNNSIVTEWTEPYNTWLKSITIYRMAASNVFPPISFVYKRSVFDRIGMYRESLPVLGDWEFNLRFVEHFDIGLIPEMLAYYHHRLSIHHGNLSNSVVKDDSDHRFYETMLRNELLRKDLAENKLGMGYLVNLAQSFETVHAQIAPIEAVLNKIKMNPRLAWLKRILRRIAR
mgnify:CR=1 FL=1